MAIPNTSIMLGAMKRRVRLILSLWRQFRVESAVALFNLATVASGFLLQIVVLRLTGAPGDADAYFATAALPQVGLSIAIHIMTGALMPHLARLDGPERSTTVWSMLLLIMGCGLPIAAVLYLTASSWTFLIFPGFADCAVSSSVNLAALAALATPFAIATCVLSANLYAQRRFLSNEGIALATSLGLAVAAALLIPRMGIIILGWLVLGRFILQTLLLLAFLPLRAWHVSWSSLTPVLRRARALLAGALYFKSDLLVDRYLLSLAPAGSLSIVVFGQSIFAAASGVLGQSLANTASPALAIAHEMRDGAAFRSTLRRNLLLIGSASVLLMIISIVAVPPIAAILTRNQSSHGSMDLRTVLILFGGVPIGACVGSLLANAFYAMGDTRTPTIMTVSTFTLFLIAKIFVFTHFDLYAFCGLTSIYYLGNGVIMAWLLLRKMRQEFAA